MELGDRILELRKRAGLSQEELADRLGVSRQAVGKWENGAATPDISNVVELSRVFGVTLSELLGIEEAEAAGGAGELKKMEELLRRYIDEQKELSQRDDRADASLEKRDGKRRNWFYGLFGALFLVICAVIIGGGNRIASLEDRLSGISSETQQSIFGLSQDISSMQRTVTDILKKQASLFSDYGFDPVGYDKDSGSVEMELWAAPKTLSDGLGIEVCPSGDEHRRGGNCDGRP